MIPHSSRRPENKKGVEDAIIDTIYFFCCILQEKVLRLIFISVVSCLLHWLK